MEINADRLWRRLEALSRITDPERPWTRRSFTPLFLEGRQWLQEEFRAAGLEPRIDEGGNLLARMEGSEQGLKPIVIGSHSDTVPSGGRYDGMLGLLAALEVAQSLRERDQRLRHPLEVVDFLAEEPSEFGISCVGSRALAGTLSEDMLDLTRPDGTTLREALRYVGGDPDRLEEARRGPDSIAAYVEVHIEQGRVLENEGTKIGVVTDIAGIHRDRIVVAGRADHAGATPMKLRHDALVGAAAVVDAVYRRALAISAEERPLVATVGKLDVSPNAINAVPGRVEMILEVRSGDEAATRSFAGEILAEITPRMRELGLEISSEEVSHARPTPCADVVREAIDRAGEALGLSRRDMPSGAGHDGVHVSRCGPIGMIFTPCRDGRSHAPEESIEPSQAADGASALAGAVLELDRTLG
jgi:N-carbamoyl-L-amino-acid hydrolase